MKAIFLIITVVLIGAPFLILSVNASQFNGTCPNNHGGMINDTGGFSCVTTFPCEIELFTWLDQVICPGHMVFHLKAPSIYRSIVNDRCCRISRILITSTCKLDTSIKALDQQ